MFKISNILENLREKKMTTVNVDSGKINVNADLNDRLGKIYGDELIKLQLLYENWVTKETWLIKDEAMPLLMALSPEEKIENNNEINETLNDMWLHARSCVEQGLLKVINRNDVPEKWRSHPLDIYRWAKISRIKFPDVFASLMEFISNTVLLTDAGKQVEHDNISGAAVLKFDQDREKVLGMALAILAAYPDQCRNNKGRIKADKIINIINEKGMHWVDKEPDMSSVAMKDLINKWLNTVTMEKD